MKNPSRKITVWTVALLSLALAQAPRAADENDAAKTAVPSQQTGDLPKSGGPAAYNKATGIIGMEIRNQSDERLGKIRDVVFDLNSERVSYVVLGVKQGFLGMEDKYLAVPMSALKTSADGHYLILNANKDKVAAAKGFERNDWPAIGSPSWGAEPFWQSDNQNPGIAPSEKSEKVTPPTTDQSDKYPPANSDKPDNNLTPTPAPAPAPAPEAAPDSDQKQP